MMNPNKRPDERYREQRETHEQGHRQTYTPDVHQRVVNPKETRAKEASRERKGSSPRVVAAVVGVKTGPKGSQEAIFFSR